MVCVLQTRMHCLAIVFSAAAGESVEAGGYPWGDERLKPKEVASYFDAAFLAGEWYRNTQNTSVENDYGYLEGRITDKDGDEWNFVLEFIHEGGQWQLIAYDFDFGDPPLRLT